MCMGRTPELTPDRMQAIREGLGLTQEEAGRLLGGGPRAFTKYEAGSLKPRAAAINLLRVLELYPDALGVLRGGELHPASSRVPAPFEVESDDIASLGPPAFPNLLRQLLSAEAREYGLPQDGIRVASNIHVPDGGEDGRISWRGRPERTPFLPSRLCQFQLKVGKIEPARAGNDVLTNGTEVKAMVRSVLERGGHYIMLCAQPYNQRQVEARQRGICDALRKAGLSVPDHLVSFWEADQIAAWVNTHQSVALWVREEVGLGTLGGFTSWNHWKGRSEHSVRWVDDPRLADLRRTIRDKVTESGAVLRVVGLSGIGKSRLCLEAPKRVGEDEIVGARFGTSSCTQYSLKWVRKRFIPSSKTGRLRRTRRRGRGRLRCARTCHLGRDSVAPGQPPITGRIDMRFPLISMRLPSRLTRPRRLSSNPSSTMSLQHWIVTPLHASHGDSRKLQSESPTNLIRGDTSPIRPTTTLLTNSSAVVGPRTGAVAPIGQLLAAFGPVRVEPAEEAYLGTFQTVGTESSTEEHLARIADLGRQPARDDLYTGIQRLVQRGVVKRRGGLGTIQPRPIAVRLAERQWRKWDKRKWDRVLSGDIGSDLSVSAARRLAELNASEIANKVVDHVCREGGDFDRVDGIVLQSRVKVLSGDDPPPHALQCGVRQHLPVRRNDRFD